MLLKTCTFVGIYRWMTPECQNLFQRRKYKMQHGSEAALLLWCFFPPPRAQISKNNAGDIVMVISQNGGKNAWVINATLHPCVCTTVSQYWREQFLFIFFLLFHSRPFLYKWYKWSERQFQVFKSEHTQQFTSLPRIFTLINWGCYYGIKIDEVNLSESYGTFALNEEVHSRSALGMFHVQHHH